MSIDKLTATTNDLLEWAHNLVYLTEHFIRKTNKSTSLDIRNHIRLGKDVFEEYKKGSIDFFKDEDKAI